MTGQAIETAMELLAKLINQESVCCQKENSNLYQAYSESGEVFELVNQMIRALNLELYDHKNGLYLTAGNHNLIFGYTNEELKNEIGIRTNRELYLCYFIIYHIITKFYTNSATYTYQDYVKILEIADAVDQGFQKVAKQMETIVLTEMEDYSFQQINMIWEELAITSNDNSPIIRADKGSKAGLVKKVFNFLQKQELFVSVEERYYPTDRFQAMIEQYFEVHQSRIYDIMMGGDGDGTY